MSLPGLTELKSRYWQNAFFSGGPREESISLSFPISKSFLHSLAVTSSSILQTGQVRLSPSPIVTSLVLHSTSISNSLKDPWDYIGPSWLI